MESNDQTLLNQWYQHGDAEAFHQITRRYAGLVYGTCRRILRNPSDAEDVAQECFETLAVKTRADGRALGAWLHTVATRRALDRIKMETRRRDREHRAAAGQHEPAETDWDEIYAVVDEAIAALPEKERVPLVAHFLEGQTHAAIAAKMGISRPTVGYRIQQGLEGIRRELKKRNVTTTAAALGSALGSGLTAEAAPAALIAGLGKLAVSSLPAVTQGAAPIFTTTIAGGILMKKALIAGVVVIAFGGGGALLLRPQTPAPEPSPIAAPIESESDPVFEAPAARAPEADVMIATAVESAPEPGPETIPAGSVVRLRPGAGDAGQGDLAIAGRVVDNNGKPIQGVRVSISGNSVHLGAITEDDGTFRVTGLAPGFYRGSAWHERYSGATLDEIDAGDESVLFDMQGRAVVSGRVIDGRTGLAIPRFSVGHVRGHLVDRKPSKFSYSQRPVDDPQGKFELSDVETGASTIIVLANGYMASFTPISLENSDAVRNIVIEIQPGVIAEGRVTDGAGTPVVGAWIFSSAPPPLGELKRYGALSEENIEQLWGSILTGKSGGDGRFSINTLRGDEPELFAVHFEHGTGQVPLAWSGASPLRGVNIVLEDTAGAAEVLVTIDGKPAVDTNVIAALPGGKGTPYQMGKTGPDGRVTLTDLPEGAVGVAAYIPVSHQQHPQRVIVDTVIETGKTAQVAIDYKPGTAVLEGVVGLDGQLATGGYLDFSMVEGERQEPSKAQIGIDGTYRFEGLPAGEASLKVAATFGEIRRSRLISIRIADGKSQRLDIDLGSSGALQGVVSGMAETGYGSALALHGEHSIEEATPDRMRSIRDFIVGRAQFWADGAYHIEGVPPGRHTLLVTVGDAGELGVVKEPRFATTIVDVADGETTTVDFDMGE